MTFRHIVLFRFLPSVTEEQKTTLTESLRRLGRCVETVRAMSVGQDTGLYPRNYDYAVVVDFDDESGYMTFAKHPEHLRMVEPTGALLADTASAQFLVHD